MGSQVLWYTTRGAGAVSLVLLSAVVCLGLLTRLRLRGARWPAFLTAAVHRDLALITLAFLLIHIVTAVVDPFTHLGIVAATVPFGSSYRTLWLGLGTLSFELGLAVGVSSLARRMIGTRAWRGVHWLAYACWPIAVVHGLGTGTDARSAWLDGITVVCVGAVLACLLWRAASAPVVPLSPSRGARFPAEDGR